MSWEQLSDIAREASAVREAERSAPPVACPNDGEPLVSNGAGVLGCSFDGWRAS